MFRVWWGICIRLCYKFPTESNSERILKIGQYLVKLWAARVRCLVFLTHSVCSTGFYWTVNQRACSSKLHRSISVYASKQASKACRRLSEYIIARICTSNTDAPPPPCTSASSLVAAGGARTRGRHDSTEQQRTPPTCIRRHTMPTGTQKRPACN